MVNNFSCYIPVLQSIFTININNYEQKEFIICLLNVDSLTMTKKENTMSEELKLTEEKEPKCFCQSKGFRKFLVIALGTFVGVYSALSLFAAIHKPQIPPCPFGGFYAPPAPMAAPCPFKNHREHFDKGFIGDRGDFQKAVRGDKKIAPFDKDRFDDKD